MSHFIIILLSTNAALIRLPSSYSAASDVQVDAIYRYRKALEDILDNFIVLLILDPELKTLDVNLLNLYLIFTNLEQIWSISSCSETKERCTVVH